MRQFLTPLNLELLFQSAPDHSAGRCVLAPFHVRTLPGFNPRPTIRPGDARLRFASLKQCIVSIRARPFGRAMLRALPCALYGMELFQSAPDHSAGRCAESAGVIHQHSCFNPRPTIRPGDAMLMCATEQCKTVSIRARPFGRAMHHGLMLRSANGQFQSAPDHSAGRCHAIRARIRASWRFNPRPTIRPGDAVYWLVAATPE